MEKISSMLAIALCLFMEGIAFGQEFVESEVIVKFRKGVDEAAISSFNQQNGTAVIDTIQSLGIRKLSLPEAKKVMEMVAIYNAAPIVDYAQPNYIYHAVTTPNDPRYPEQWALHNIGQTGGTPDADIDASEAWDVQTGSDSVVVAMIDSGVDWDHRDLGDPRSAPSNIWLNPGETLNGVDDDGNGYVDDIIGWDFVNSDNNPDDDNGHGTHCSGIIGALGNNGIGVVGTNWRVKIMALKFLNALGFGSTWDAVQAINYSTMMKRDYGVNLVATSNSWGGGEPDPSLENAIIEADNNGVLFVAAAGNANSDNDANPHYPSSYPEYNVMAVAATDHDDYKSYAPGPFGWGSHWGKQSVDLGAPGSSILSTLPGDTYGSFSGTSMAAPYVTGVVALLKAEFPGMSHYDVKERILATTDFIPSLSWTNSTMQGEVLTGGRLNAYNALIGPSSDTEIEVITDKYTYTVGDRMLVHVRLFNLGTPLSVRAHLELEMPDGSLYLPATMDMPFTLSRGFIVTTPYDITIPVAAPAGAYTWRAQLLDSADNLLSQDEAEFEISTSVLAPAEATAGEFFLYQNRPNPFNPETWIPYQLGADASVSIRIYDVTGQLIRTLDLGKRKAGEYLSKDKAAYWDGRNQTGERAASGVYFSQIQAGDFTATRKMLLLK